MPSMSRTSRRSHTILESDMKYMMAVEGTGNYGNDENRNGGD